MIALTICIKNFKFEIDIMVKPEQRVSEVLEVLIENNKLPYFNIDKGIIIRSWRKGTLIDPHLTFKMEQILQGDILYIEG